MSQAFHVPAGLYARLPGTCFPPQVDRELPLHQAFFSCCGRTPPQQIAQVRRGMVLKVTADRHHSHDVGDRGASPTDLQALASPCFSRCRTKPGVIRSLSCSFKCARPHRHHPRSAAFAGKPGLSETRSAPVVPRSSLPLITGQGPGYRDLAREQIARCKRACLMRETFAQGREG